MLLDRPAKLQPSNLRAVHALFALPPSRRRLEPFDQRDGQQLGVCASEWPSSARTKSPARTAMRFKRWTSATRARTSGVGERSRIASSWRKVHRSGVVGNSRCPLGRLESARIWATFRPYSTGPGRSSETLFSNPQEEFPSSSGHRGRPNAIAARLSYSRASTRFLRLLICQLRFLRASSVAMRLSSSSISTIRACAVTHCMMATACSALISPAARSRPLANGYPSIGMPLPWAICAGGIGVP